MAVRTRLYTRGSQAFSRTLTKPPIQVTHQGRNNTNVGEVPAVREFKRFVCFKMN
jgi:hypothetical protein